MSKYNDKPMQLDIVKYMFSEVLDDTIHLYFVCPSDTCLHEWRESDGGYVGCWKAFEVDEPPLIIKCSECHTEYIVIGWDKMINHMALITKGE